MAPQPEPHDNENWRYGPNTIMVNIRNIVDPTMTHILGALLKARNENISPSPPDLINFNITNPMDKTMNRINPISPEFMSLSKALGMYRCGSMNQWAFSGPN